MAIERDRLASTNNFPRIGDAFSHSKKNSYALKDLVLAYLEKTKDIQNRQIFFARKQVLSLYRRIHYHQNNKALISFYEHDILTIIYQEKNNEDDSES